MKKNRKQLKREKKNLRRLNEMKRKKITSVIENIEVTDFGTDHHGNATHRINEKGVVDSSVTEMFGCEIEKSIPAFVRSFADKMGLGEFIRVPIRKNGITGSGATSRCHFNVGSLVDWKGGTSISGFHISFWKDDVDVREKGTTTFHHHTVWLNPEGNASCVTNNYDYDTDERLSGITKDSITTKGDKEYLLFIPVFVGTCHSIGWKCLDATIWTDWKYSGIGVTDNVDSWKEIPFYKVKTTNLVTNKSGKKTLSRWNDTDKKRLRRKGWDMSGFSNPSLATGKTWTEIHSELKVA